MSSLISPLEQRFKTAFPNAFKGRQLSHEECVALRPRLIAISSEGFESSLAQVLLDLLNTHTGKVGESENAEEVIRFLDVATDSECLTALPTYNHERECETDKLLRDAKSESLADITSQQAAVLVEWLHAAKAWPDLSWYLDEVDSALAYWATRSTT